MPRLLIYILLLFFLSVPGFCSSYTENYRYNNIIQIVKTEWLLHNYASNIYQGIYQNNKGCWIDQKTEQIFHWKSSVSYFIIQARIPVFSNMGWIAHLNCKFIAFGALFVYNNTNERWCRRYQPQVNRKYIRSHWYAHLRMSFFC